MRGPLGTFDQNVETSTTTTKHDLVTYYLTMKELMSRVRGNTIGIVGLTRKHKGKYSRRNLSLLHFYSFSNENAK